jgi:hypothetical protein
VLRREEAPPVKLNMPQKQCKGIEFGGRSYDATKSGSITVDDPKAAKALMAVGGCFPASNTPKAKGRMCTDCGFTTWFTTCGRCGGRCERE